MMSRVSIWGTVKVHGKGKRVAANWNGKRVFSRMATDKDEVGGILHCTWPEIWTFRPNDENWQEQFQK